MDVMDLCVCGHVELLTARVVSWVTAASLALALAHAWCLVGRSTPSSNTGIDLDVYWPCISDRILLTPFWRRQSLQKNQRQCSLVRRGRSASQAGRSATWREAAVLSDQARTVRGTGPDGPRPRAGRSARAQGRRKIADSAWISLPGGTPSGRRDPRSCLGSGSVGDRYPLGPLKK
jgi:hypothetical protein